MKKQNLWKKLQSIEHCVGFCGDGANDCGALKAADVGISLSEAEASVAAPFTSRDFDIRCVIQLIREGRAALVTSFSCFKYMALYSAIQFTTVSILYRTASNLGDFQFLFIDLALILPIAIFMGRAEPYKTLAIKRPTANLVSKKIIGSLLGHIMIIIGFQTFLYGLVQQQSWYVPPSHHRNKPNIVSSDNTVLFLLSLYQYTFIAVVLSVGPPYRQSMYKNIWFMAAIILITIFTLYITIQPAHRLKKVLQLTTTSDSFTYIILGTALLYVACSWFGETVIFTKFVRHASNLTNRIFRLRAKKRKQWKVITEELRI
jgi:cation-transporting P-type ATPase 13A2